MAAAAQQQTGRYLASLDAFVPSPFQPRKAFRGLDELAASMLANGQIDDVIVRKKKDGKLELVDGERRYRAASIAGIEQLAYVQRAYTDDEVISVQLAEALGRSDLHPLEEADAIAVMRKRGRELADIAATLGRPAGFIARRLQLTTLSSMCRENFELGRISAGVAEVLARIPHVALQDEAIEELLRPRYGDNRENGPTVTEARDFVRRRLMRRMSEVQWDAKDAELVPEAGACVGCSKRTGAQAELFADLAKEDLCTDATCWQSKSDAEWKRRTGEAKKVGLKVLSAKETKELFPYANTSGVYGGKYDDLDGEVWSGGKHKKLRSLLKVEDLPITIARDPEGRIRQLVPKDVVKKLLPKESAGSGYTAPKPSKKELERRADQKAKESARDVVLDALITKLRGVKKHPIAELETWLRYIVEGLVGRCATYDGKRDAEALTRRGIEVAKENTREVGEQLVDYAQMASVPELVALAIELLLRSEIRELGELGPEGEHGFAQRVLEHAGVDWLEIEQTAIAEAREKLDAKLAKKAAKKKSSKKTRAK